jgi:hypothetical protein
MSEGKHRAGAGLPTVAGGVGEGTKGTKGSRSFPGATARRWPAWRGRALGRVLNPRSRHPNRSNSSRMYFKTRFAARLGQGLDKIPPVHVRLKEVSVAVGRAHDVINRSRILDSQFVNGSCDPSRVGEAGICFPGVSLALNPRLLSGILSGWRECRRRRRFRTRLTQGRLADSPTRG